MFHLLITKEDKVLALQRAFYRSDMGLPNITNLMSTVFIFLVVVWFAPLIYNRYTPQYYNHAATTLSLHSRP